MRRFARKTGRSAVWRAHCEARSHGTSRCSTDGRRRAPRIWSASESGRRGPGRRRVDGCVFEHVPGRARARGEPAVRAHVDLSRQGVAEAKPLVDGLVTVRLTLETTFLFLFEWSTASAFPDSAHPAARRPARSSPRDT